MILHYHTISSEAEVLRLNIIPCPAQLAGARDPFQVTVILACVQVASIILVSIYTDVGRRVPTVYGFGIASVSVLAIGIIGCFDYESKSLGSLLVSFSSSSNNTCLRTS